MLKVNNWIITFLIGYLIFLSTENLLIKVVDVGLLKSINIVSMLIIFVMFAIYTCNDLKYNLIPRNYEGLFAIYLIICAISGYFSGSTYSDIINSILYETRYIFLFITLRLICIDRENYLYFIRGCILLGLVQILLGLLQYWGTDDIRAIFLDTKYMSESIKLYEHVQESHRMVGTFLNKNIFSIYMLFNLLCLITILDIFKSKVTQYTLILLHFIAIILSGSRTVWLIVLLLFAKRVRWRSKKMLPVVAVLACTIVIMAYTVEIRDSSHDKSTLLYKATEVFNPEYYDIVKSYGRLAYLFATFEILRDHPIVGLGAGKWGAGIAYKDSQEYEHIVYGEYSIPKGVMHDNNYASISGQFGAIALTVFVLMILSVMRYYNQKAMVPVDSLSLVYTMSVCMLLISITWTPFASKPISFYFWTLLGLTTSPSLIITSRYKLK